MMKEDIGCGKSVSTWGNYMKSPRCSDDLNVQITTIADAFVGMLVAMIGTVPVGCRVYLMTLAISNARNKQRFYNLIFPIRQ